jgi:hypothetical protein
MLARNFTGVHAFCYQSCFIDQMVFFLGPENCIETGFCCNFKLSPDDNVFAASLLFEKTCTEKSPGTQFENLLS